MYVYIYRERYMCIYIYIYMHFSIFGLLAVFDFFMLSQGSGRYPIAFLDLPAPFSQSFSPFRATATPFIPNIITFTTSYQSQHLVAGACSSYLDLPIYCPSKNWDPSRLVAKVKVCRKFLSTIFPIGTFVELWTGQLGILSKSPIRYLGIFCVYFWKHDIS